MAAGGAAGSSIHDAAAGAALAGASTITRHCNQTGALLLSTITRHCNQTGALLLTDICIALLFILHSAFISLVQVRQMIRLLHWPAV